MNQGCLYCFSFIAYSFFACDAWVAQVKANAKRRLNPFDKTAVIDACNQLIFKLGMLEPIHRPKKSYKNCQSSTHALCHFERLGL